MTIATATGWSLEYISKFDWMTINRMLRFIDNNEKREYRNMLSVMDYHALVSNGKGNKAGKIRRHFEKTTGYNGHGRQSNFVNFLLVHTGGQLFKPTK